jgi:hypothetical protein
MAHELLCREFTEGLCIHLTNISHAAYRRAYEREC